MKFQIKNVVMSLIVLTVLVFLLQVFLGPGFTNSFMLVSEDIFTRPWIMVTSMFLHAGIAHLLFNMYVLFMFGSLLEHKIGSKRFILLYLLSGIAASFLSSFFYPRALGASGAIMGILGALIILMPNLRVLFFFFIPMPFWIAAIVIALVDLFGVFYPTGIGNIAHLTGMACGLIYGLYLKGKRKTYRKKFISKRHLDDDDIEEYLKSGRI